MKLYEISNWGEDWGNDDAGIDDPGAARRIQGLKSASGGVYVEPKKKSSKPLSRRKQRELNQATLNKYSNKGKLAEFDQLQRNHTDMEFDNWRDSLRATLGYTYRSDHHTAQQKRLTVMFQPLIDQLDNYESAIKIAREDYDLDGLRTALQGRRDTQASITDKLDTYGVELHRGEYYR
jgi:hypothetical protein